MASSNIKLFDENKGNMLTDTEFNISTQRLNGLQTGVASSQLQNKAMYQASLMAYAIAQIMMQNGLNANDSDAVSAFVANLSGTMLQKVYDIATTAEAQAGVATGKWMSPALVKAAIDKTLADNNYLPKSGGTMTGNLILNANPTAKLGAATKQYVDSIKGRLQTNIDDVNTNLFSQITKLYSGVTAFSVSNVEVDSFSITGSNTKYCFYADDFTITVIINVKYDNSIKFVFPSVTPGGSATDSHKAYAKANVNYYVNNSLVKSDKMSVTTGFTIGSYIPGTSGVSLKKGDVLKIVLSSDTTSGRGKYELNVPSASRFAYTNYYFV